MSGEQDVADNCGVSFDGTCDESEAGKSGDPAPEECKEGDTECFERRRRSMGSEPGSLPASIVQATLGEGPQDAMETLKKLSIGSNGPPEPPFEGLPKDYFKKNYRPDYPRDLQMRKVCAKSQAKKSSGVTKSHVKAVFARRLEEHNIQMMFEYFLGLCVVHQPDDPWSFICELCDRMIFARQDVGAFDSLPRILTAEHIEAIFRIYDRIENGFITMAQYKSALEAMGMSRFSMIPEGYAQNTINKDTFVKEATDAINDMLRSFMVFDENPSSKDTGSYEGDGNRSATEMGGTRDSRDRSAEEASSYSYRSGSQEYQDGEGSTAMPTSKGDGLNLF